VEIAGFDVLGLHPVRPDSSDEYDGFDLALHLSSGDVCVFGVRTGTLVTDGDPTQGWLHGYRPVPVDFVPGAVEHWDFQDPMWVGAGLVWSNAAHFTRAGIDHLMRMSSFAKVLAGPDGGGLPRLAELDRLR